MSETKVLINGENQRSVPKYKFKNKLIFNSHKNPVQVDWQNLNATVNYKKNEKCILKEISGSAKSGELLAIMERI